MKIGIKHLQDTKFEYLRYDFRNAYDIYKYELENGLKRIVNAIGRYSWNVHITSICEIMITVVHLYFKRI